MTYQKPTPQEVLEAIERAFPVTPVPELIASHQTTENWKAKEEEIRTGLEGKSWREVDPKVVDEHWLNIASIHGNATFNYYFPALLWRAMLEENDIPTYDVTDPRPCEHCVFCYLHVNAEDIIKNTLKYENKNFESFTLEQREAIKTYLRFKMGDAPDFDIGYFETLHWYWGDPGDPDVEVRNQFQRSLFSWQRPTAPDEERERLIQRIEKAWAQVPYPGDESIVCLRSWGEPFDLFIHFAGRDWNSIHPRLLNLASYNAGIFFELPGYHYYLPAFLRAYLLNEMNGDNFLRRLLTLSAFSETGSRKKHISRRQNQLLALFNSDQIDCLVHFLTVVCERKLEKCLSHLREFPLEHERRHLAMTMISWKRDDFLQIDQTVTVLQRIQRAIAMGVDLSMTVSYRAGIS